MHGLVTRLAATASDWLFNHQLQNAKPIGAQFHLLDGSIRFGNELDDDLHLKGFKRLRTFELKRQDGDTVLQLLRVRDSNPDIFAAALCFFPGFAFTFGTNTKKVSALVCLECNWVYVYAGRRHLEFVPGEATKAQLEAIYLRYV